MIPLWSGVSCDAARTACILGNFLGKKISFVGFFSIGPKYQLHFAKRNILTFVWNVWRRSAKLAEVKKKSKITQFFFIITSHAGKSLIIHPYNQTFCKWYSNFLNTFYTEPLFNSYSMQRVSPAIRLAAP